MNSKIAIVAIALVLGGCVSKYRTDSYEPPVEQLSSTVSAYVMLAGDGTYGSKVYQGSGGTLSRETRSAISKHLNNVEIGSGREDRKEAFAKARANNISYVFEPIILHWEDRATEWSGRPDRITIKIVVWDPVTEKALSTSVERASSKWATFGGDHPQNLLPKLLATFSNRLFR